LVFFLPQPAKRIGDVDADAVVIRHIRPAAMEHAAGIDQHGAGRHFGIADLIIRWLIIIRPVEAAGADLGCAILFREIRNRPDRVELRFNGFEMHTPGPAVAMDGLLRLARLDTNDLGEVELYPLAKGL